MQTPNPRGFSPRSDVATICDNAQMFDRRRGNLATAEPEPIEKPIVPRKYLRALERRHLAAAKPLATLATVTVTTDEKILLIPTGRKVKRKKGKHAGATVDEKVRTVLVTATATVHCQSGPDFYFRATNRSRTHTVFDSRTAARVPLEFVRAELERICGTDKAADQLAEIFPEPTAPRPRPKPIAAAAPPSQPRLGVKRVPFSARKHLLGALIGLPIYGIT